MKSKWIFRIIIVILAIFIIPWLVNFADNEYIRDSGYTDAYLIRIGLYSLLLIILIIRWIYIFIRYLIRKNQRT